jgi:hypothetical protein
MAKRQERSMNTTIISLVANEHVTDLRKAAERRRLASNKSLTTESATPQARTVELRLATADDAPVVRRLAALDAAPVLDGPVLLARHDGQAVAALSLDDGRVVADPFVRTGDAVAMLRLRAAHLTGRSPHRQLRGILRPRVA